MPSLNSLKQAQADKDQQKIVKIKEEKKKSLKENSLAYEKNKNDQKLLEETKTKNQAELLDIKRKRSAISASLKDILSQIKGEFSRAKNDSESLFRGFFKKDKEGNLSSNLDKEEILKLEELSGMPEKVGETRERRGHLRTKNKNIETVLVNKKQEEKGLYEKTEKYLEDTYLGSKDYVSKIESDVARGHQYINSPFESHRLEQLVKDQPQEIENVKEMFLENIDNRFGVKEEKSGLLKEKEAIEKVENFWKERSEVLKDMDKFEQEVRDFIDKIWDIDEVRSKYDDKKEAYKEKIVFRDNFDYINQKFEENQNLYKLPLKGLIDLEKVKKYINGCRNFMDYVLELKAKDKEDVSRIYDSKYDLKKERGELGARYIGGKGENLENKLKEFGIDFFAGRGIFTMGEIIPGFNSFSDLKNDYEKKKEEFEKEKAVIKNFSERVFDEQVFTKKMELDHKREARYFKSDLDTYKENLSIVKSYISEINNNENSRWEKGERGLDQKIAFTSTYSHPVGIYTIEKIEKQEEKMSLMKKDQEEKEKQLAILEKKTPMFGKEKHYQSIRDLREKISKIKDSLEGSERQELQKIHYNSVFDDQKTPGNFGFKSLLSILNSEIMAPEEKNSYDYKRIRYSEVLDKRFRKEVEQGKEIHLRDYVEAAKARLNELKNNLESQKENFAEYNIAYEKYLKLKTEKEQAEAELKKFFLEKNKK